METSNAQEIWETTTGGTFWVHVKDPRQPGGWGRKKFGGKGIRKITLTVEEREFNQELVPEENLHLDPFHNGLLVRIHPKDVTRGDYELTDEQLLQLLQIEDDAVFGEQLEGMKSSEVVVRRLLALADKNATKARFETIQEFVDDHYRIGKTSRVVKEILEDDAKYADADL